MFIGTDHFLTHNGNLWSSVRTSHTTCFYHNGIKLEVNNKDIKGRDIRNLASHT